jgi:hypothetical protein
MARFPNIARNARGAAAKAIEDRALHAFSV